MNDTPEGIGIKEVAVKPAKRKTGATPVTAPRTVAEMAIKRIATNRDAIFFMI